MAHTYTSIKTQASNTPKSHSRLRLPALPRRLFRVGGIIVLFTFFSLIILSIVSYLSPLRGATRPCLPFSIQRLSTSAHSALACPERIGTEKMATIGTNDSGGVVGGENNVNGANGVTSSGGVDVGNGSRLEGWLRTQRESFFEDIAKGSLKGWTVVTGNEAGGRLHPKIRSHHG